MLSLINNRRFQFVLSVFAVILVMPVVANAFALELGVMIMQIFARLTGWAGILLNMAIMELVFNMGNILSSRIGVSVENSWSVIRDIMNLLFIFSLIYIGFLVILDASSSHARRLLPPLIIAALLVNFSLFFTKAIIDVSNIAAAEIYMTTIGNPLQNASNGSQNGQVSEALINIGISGAFMQSLGLKDLLSPNQAAGNQNNISYQVKLSEACTANDDGTRNCTVDVLVYFLLSIVFFLIAAYAFAVGAFMLAWRFIVLIFLLVFSPLMFAGMIFPKAARLQSRWWGTFLNAAFFAPAYMLMLFIAYSIASRIQVFNQNDAMFHAVSGSYTSVDLVLNFVLVIGFLLGATWVSREMSFHGSKGTLNLVDNLRRRGQRVLAAGTIGGTAWGLRNTAGRQADKLSQSTRLRNLAGSDSNLARWTGAAWLGEKTIRGSKKVANSSFDARNLASSNLQKEIGKGQKKGYAGIKADRDKDREQFAEKTLGTVDVSIKKDEYGNVERYEEGHEYAGETKYKDAKIDEKIRTDSTVEKARKELRAVEKSGDKKAIEKARNNLQKATQVAEAKVEYSRILNYKKSKEQIDKINGAIADAASASIGILTAFTAGPAVVAAAGKAAVIAAKAAPAAAAAAVGAATAAAAAAPVMTAGALAGGAASLKWRDAKGALHKKYGDDGTKAKKAKKKRDDLKILSDQLKEDGDATPKDDKKEDES